MAPTLPGKAVRKTSRAGLGGGALLIALALFLLFRGFGPGGTGQSGSGTTENDAEGAAPLATTDPRAVMSKSTTSAAGPVLTDDERKALSGDLLTILIDEHDYLMEVPGEPTAVYRPTPLERLVELAGLTKGDTNGTRIRILRRSTARASAEQKLKLELGRAGIKDDATLMPAEFIP